LRRKDIRRKAKIKSSTTVAGVYLNNYLDPESVNALNIPLQKYDGTMLPLTHDQDVVKEVAIWNVDPGKMEDQCLVALGAEDLCTCKILPRG
jgi:hypothetical protein